MNVLSEQDRRLLAELAPRVIHEHRAYLRATVVGAAACTVCRRDVAAPGLCDRCTIHDEQHPGELAHRVGFMTYGVGWSRSGRQHLLRQSGWVMRQYKEVGADHGSRTLVQMLCLAGLSFHQPCLSVLSAQPGPLLWSTVPSRREDRTTHPLREIALRLSRRPESEVRLESTRPSRERTVDPDHFRAPDGVPTGAHVLLLEDTWTSGAATQSAALTLRRAGAAQVSALVLARWMDPDDAGTRTLLDTVVGAEYVLNFCPWTGVPCVATTPTSTAR